MTRQMKRILTAALCLAMFAGLAAPAMALEGADLSKPCAVTLDVSDDAEQRDDLGESVTEVLVYQVAGANEDGTFTLADRFAALGENDQWNEGKLSGSTRLQDLQDAALEALLAEAPATDAADAEEEPALPAADVTVEAAVVGGRIELPGAGLYLLAPQGVETDNWSYTFSPFMLAAPALDPESGILQYEFPVSMKLERVSRLSGLVIEKTLLNYNATLGPTTFLFEVRAVLNGELVYSNVVPLTLYGPGTQSVTVEGIPAGSHVTVTEVYSGASYTPVGGQVSVEVEDLPLPDDGQDWVRVPFTNDYTNRRVPDTSVTNTFVYNGTGWQWQSSQEAEG